MLIKMFFVYFIFFGICSARSLFAFAFRQYKKFVRIDDDAKYNIINDFYTLILLHFCTFFHHFHITLCSAVIFQQSQRISALQMNIFQFSGLPFPKTIKKSSD